MLDFHWFEHPIHRRAPKGGEEGVNGEMYKAGEFEPFYVPRAVMPQVDETDLGELLAFIRERGIAVIETMISPELLRFHQQVDMKKVHAMDADVLAKPLLVSLDDYVLDGNHRAAGHKIQGTSAVCLQIMAEFEDAMAVIYAFPKTYEYGDGKFHPVRN